MGFVAFAVSTNYILPPVTLLPPYRGQVNWFAVPCVISMEMN